MTTREIDTPALLVDVDCLAQNIARMQRLGSGGGKRLRPHTKTHKCPEIARMQVAAGACGITVAKLGEAEVMAAAGIEDIFIANQILGPAKVDRLARLLGTARTTVGADSAEAVAAAVAAARRSGGRVLRLRVEVDTGHHRAGIRRLEDLVALARAVRAAPGIVFDGVFTHEGHVYAAPASERAATCIRAAGVMSDCVVALRSDGWTDPVVSVGSTPGAQAMAGIPTVTEMRPGVYVLGDAMQTAMGAAEADCAATVLCTVTSRPDERTAIADAGTKALSGDRADAPRRRHGYVPGRPDLQLDWASEEHLHITLLEPSLAPDIGDRLRIVPHHACACVNMHDAIYAVQGETVLASWGITARGRMC